MRQDQVGDEKSVIQKQVEHGVRKVKKQVGVSPSFLQQ